MNTYLRELTVQFAKFGIVGAIAFCIDYGLFLLSVVGLGVNQLVLWMCVDLLAWLAWVGKLAATFIVMIFNFVTRKVFLEDHDGRRR